MWAIVWVGNVRSSTSRIPASGEPPLVLRGFEKTAFLQPGKADVLSFDLIARDFSVWDVRAGSWKRAPGTFKAHVGRHRETCGWNVHSSFRLRVIIFIRST